MRCFYNAPSHGSDMCLTIWQSTLAPNPLHDDGHRVLLFPCGQFPPRRDAVPFGQASPAAGSGGVLCSKYGVAAHRCLLAVIFNHSRCQTPADEVLCMVPNRVYALFPDLLKILFRQAEAAAELGLCQTVK